MPFMRFISWIGLLIAGLVLVSSLLSLPRATQGDVPAIALAFMLALILACCAGSLWVLTEVFYYRKLERQKLDIHKPTVDQIVAESDRRYEQLETSGQGVGNGH